MTVRDLIHQLIELGELDKDVCVVPNIRLGQYKLSEDYIEIREIEVEREESYVVCLHITLDKEAIEYLMEDIENPRSSNTSWKT